MNYGKKGVSNKEASITSKSTMKKKKRKVRTLNLVLLIILFIIIIGLVCVLGFVKGIIDSAPSIDTIDVSPTGYATTVYDNNGKELTQLVSSGANRVYATLDEIPKCVQDAFVSIEDERFWEHDGIDLKGIARAAFVGVKNGFHFTEGASTITQQLLKNNVFTDWTSEETLMDRVERKIQEQYLALQLEKITTKEYILENYLNTINLGQNTLGVQAASQRYFGKDVSELNVSEAAVIAAITQNPSAYNPVAYPENNAKRRQKVLDNMLEHEYITQAEYDEALADDVYERIQVVDSQTESSSYSYFVDALIEQVIDDLMEKKGYSYSQANKLIFSGGLSIYTTQDSAIQQICDEEANNEENYDGNVQYSFLLTLVVEHADGTTTKYTEQSMLQWLKETVSSKSTMVYSSKEEADEAIAKYKEAILGSGDKIAENGESVTYTLQPQTSVVVMDQYTGQVKAIVGGRGEKIGSRTYSRATDTVRQPGSTFKVLSTYAPAIDTAGYTLASVQDDAPYTYADGTSVRNYDNTYRGMTTFREAITRSVNIVTVKTLTDITPQLGYDYLLDFGFTTLADTDIVQSLALGGITNGVSNLELTAAYATIANSGTYNEPVFYTQILDHDGNVLIDRTPESHTVLKETTAFLLTNAMEDVLKKGTGTACNFGTTAIAGKTGTTTKNVDSWFAGYTAYYTCCIWGGYDTNASMESTKFTKNLWRSIMSRIHEDLPYKDFEMPSGIKKVSVCSKSGKLAVDGLCNNADGGSAVYTEYFADGTQPTDVCDRHISVTICKDSGQIAGEYCPEESKETKVILIESGDVEEFLNETCTVHTEETITEPEPEPDIPPEEPEPDNPPDIVLPEEPTDDTPSDGNTTGE